MPARALPRKCLGRLAALAGPARASQETSNLLADQDYSPKPTAKLDDMEERGT